MWLFTAAQEASSQFGSHRAQLWPQVLVLGALREEGDEVGDACATGAAQQAVSPAEQLCQCTRLLLAQPYNKHVLTSISYQKGPVLARHEVAYMTLQCPIWPGRCSMQYGKAQHID